MKLSSEDIDKLLDFIIKNRISSKLIRTVQSFWENHKFMCQRVIVNKKFYNDKEKCAYNRYDFGSDFKYGQYKKSDLVKEIIGFHRLEENQPISETLDYQAIFKNGFANKIYNLYNIQKLTYTTENDSIKPDEILPFNLINKLYSDNAIKQEVVEKLIIYCKLIKFFYKKKQDGISLFTKDGSDLSKEGYSILINKLIPLLYKEIDPSLVVYEMSLNNMVDIMLNCYKNFYDFALYTKRIDNNTLFIDITQIMNMLKEIDSIMYKKYNMINKRFNTNSKMTYIPLKITEAEKTYISTKLIVYRHVNKCHKEAFNIFLEVINKYKDVEREIYSKIVSISDDEKIHIKDDSERVIKYIFHYYRSFFEDYFSQYKSRDLRTPVFRTIQWIRYIYGGNKESFKVKYLLLYLRIFLFVKKEIPDFDVFYVLGQLKKIYSNSNNNCNYNISEKDFYLLNILNVFAIESTSPGMGKLAESYYRGLSYENEIKEIIYKDIYTYFNAASVLHFFIEPIVTLDNTFVEYYKDRIEASYL